MPLVAPELAGRSVGLAHDYLLVLRGAERTFAAMADLFPEQPVYTLLYDPEGTRGRFASHPVRTSRLQRLGIDQDGFRRLLPLFPDATERLPVGGHDVLLSSSSAFAHGIRPAEGAVHVCYCHSPLRYAWFEEERALGEVRPVLRPLLRATLARSRRWDREAAGRVTRYIANSRITQERIAEHFGRESAIVYPPVEVDRFSIGTPEDRFLIVCELVRHKQVDVALSAARRAGRRVDVVGTGPDAARLQAQFGDVAEFHGRLDDASLVTMEARAAALIVPNVEEFGIAAVEAMAAGRPVVAAGAGGALETVVDGETGAHFPPGDEAALAEVLRSVDFAAFDPARCRAQAERFSVAAFQRGILAELGAALA